MCPFVRRQHHKLSTRPSPLHIGLGTILAHESFLLQRVSPPNLHSGLSWLLDLRRTCDPCPLLRHPYFDLSCHFVVERVARALGTVAPFNLISVLGRKRFALRPVASLIPRNRRHCIFSQAQPTETLVPSHPIHLIHLATRQCLGPSRSSAHTTNVPLVAKLVAQTRLRCTQQLLWLREAVVYQPRSTGPFL